MAHFTLLSRCLPSFITLHVANHLHAAFTTLPHAAYSTTPTHTSSISSSSSPLKLSYETVKTPPASSPPSPPSASTDIPLILLHGLLGSKRNLRSFAKLLSSSSIFSADLRNHGDSPRSSSMSIREMVEDILLLADDLGLKKVGLVGHSLGGKVAMAAALWYPQRISFMASLDMAPVAYKVAAVDEEDDVPPTHSSISTKEAVEVVYQLSKTKYISRKHAQAMLKMQSPDMSAGMSAFLLHNLREPHPSSEDKHLRWFVNIDSIRNNLEKQLFGWPADMLEGRTFEKSSIIVRGANSSYVLDRHLKGFKKLFPNSCVRTVEGCGHWVHHEKPHDVAGMVNEALKLL